MVAIAAACAAGRIDARVTQVISDRADAAGLARARELGLATSLVERASFADADAFEAALAGALASHTHEIVALAGFMRILSSDFVTRYAGKMLNIHPSLLPKYRGLHTHRRALKAGDAEHGASVHYVTAELDGGPVIAQTLLSIQAGDHENTLAERLLPLEHQLLCAVVALIAAGRLSFGDGDITFDNEPLRKPLRWQHGTLIR